MTDQRKNKAVYADPMYGEEVEITLRKGDPILGRFIHANDIFIRLIQIDDRFVNVPWSNVAFATDSGARPVETKSLADLMQDIREPIDPESRRVEPESTE